ncbi:Peptidoglycan-binding lysin domain protein [Paenibacillus curdlanolyticus YK9]|uniref:Peptidoglycan-binding lysin domain protein n=1 Tax=Paenibacillus curdlanolyticus YK9 TaxID=717606 RepID=E0IDT6_9BACL|nr:LysM peptidoglycan-binding domain-containing protein [Paenibacillus curdlanolyticus]EFM09290.1 Peptidoglycan-binding lysin domain protein [Paenibacillus curdlanolyticus YK9]
MPDQTNGLRFDVYERVHLPDEVAAIEELEEIELVPRIQVIQQGEQALLKGQLLLTGVYRSQHDLQQPQSLEHWIPVEITLPMNRVQSIADISVEIDHFDVDLLSSRTLNITGILSLHGIQVEQQEETQQGWRDEEPITVVHRREAAPPLVEPWYPRYDSPEVPIEQQVQRDDYGQAETPQPPLAEQSEVLFQPPPQYPPSWAQSYYQPQGRPEAEAIPYSASPAYSVESEAIAEREQAPSVINWSAFATQQPIEQSEEPAAEAAPLDERPDSWTIPAAVEAEEARIDQSFYGNAREEQQFGDIALPSAQHEASFVTEAPIEAETERTNFSQPQWAPVEQEPALSSQAQAVEETPYPSAGIADARQQQQEAEAERKELKVAFGRKRAEEAPPERESVGFRSILQSSRREQEAREASDLANAAAKEPSRVTTGDEIEWKTLFLGKLADEQGFRKVRMCIVQREETLEDIAERYGKNSRELSLHNRLQDQAVTEGQVLYIP